MTFRRKSYFCLLAIKKYAIALYYHEHCLGLSYSLLCPYQCIKVASDVVDRLIGCVAALVEMISPVEDYLRVGRR